VFQKEPTRTSQALARVYCAVQVPLVTAILTSARDAVAFVRDFDVERSRNVDVVETMWTVAISYYIEFRYFLALLRLACLLRSVVLRRLDRRHLLYMTLVRFASRFDFGFLDDSNLFHSYLHLFYLALSEYLYLF
jgi:hypothetical protein